MELKDKAKEILAHLIRNRFDSLNTVGMLTTAPELINIAREAGLAALADEMTADLKSELPAHIFDNALKQAQ